MTRYSFPNIRKKERKFGGRDRDICQGVSSCYPAAVLRITPTCYNKPDPILASRSPLFLLNSTSLPSLCPPFLSFSFLSISFCLPQVSVSLVHLPARKPNIFFSPNNRSALKMIYEPFNNELWLTPIGMITSRILIVSKPHKTNGTTSQQSLELFPNSSKLPTKTAVIVTVLMKRLSCKVPFWPDSKAAL